MGAAKLTAADFAAFFGELWGKQPFAWQAALAERVLSESQGQGSAAESGTGWPEAIALPTGSGKTACMDVAVFALAAQAHRLEQGRAVTAPRRLFFVVDRRVIVDEVHTRACKLSAKLKEATSGKAKAVADNLRLIAGGGLGDADGAPLRAHVLRGGMYRSEAWAADPLQPIIVASTVDQVGSRLLFRAYGRGPKVWPIHAGLVANDSLILLDEAHCAQPFLQTLQAARKFQGWARQPLGRPSLHVVMSATPPPNVECFRDVSDEPKSKECVLGRRQLADKPATMHLVEKAKGSRATDALASELAKVAEGMVNDERKAIVVFVNRVSTARETHRILKKSHGDQAWLLTGRMRPIDKDELVRSKLARLASDPQPPASRPDTATFVVATQTLEVGADLDFDGLVTECASRDALRQRFGRLNRTGRKINARAAILVRADQANSSDDDPVYGEALQRTWEWLNRNKDEQGEIDFGIAAMTGMVGEDDPKLNAPATRAPVMLPAHIDCWAQTAPVPEPSPDVAPFLHGERDAVADVQVCWRADVDLRDEEVHSEILDALRLMPPNSLETLPVPIGMLKRWLRDEEARDDSSDVEGTGDADGEAEWGSRHDKHRVICWGGGGDPKVTSDPKDISPGDVVVIPCEPLRSSERLGDIPDFSGDSPELLDIGDIAHQRGRAKAMLRLHPNLVKAWSISEELRKEVLGFLKGAAGKREEDEDAFGEELLALLRRLSEETQADEKCDEWLKSAATALGEECQTSRDLLLRCRHVSANRVVVAGRARLRGMGDAEDSFGDENDTDASGFSSRKGKPISLYEHLDGVEKAARSHAVGCGLSEEFATAFACAGSFHDLGKADPRFQSLLRGGVRWVGREMLAKSAAMPKSRAAQARAREASGYPKNGRHELLSVRMAESVPDLLPAEDGMRDLVLHLIASHHGHCRPFAPTVKDNQEVEAGYDIEGAEAHWSGPTGLERIDSGVADRYWRLVRRHGWWGLAWLEALFRLADWKRSRWEASHGDED